MRFRISFIAVCLVVASALISFGAEECLVCHRVAIKGAHRKFPCLSCHLSRENPLPNPADASMGAKGCSGCHAGDKALFSHAMGTRKREKDFVARSYGKVDRHFFRNNCNSCHLKGCIDCHGKSGHNLVRDAGNSCYACHKGYFTGSDYRGLAPREENMRYQRGMERDGERYLKMLPDVHFRAGMECGRCHTMKSMAEGRKSAKVCLDCHRPSRKVVEHRISAHMEKLECYACHSSWGAQEYGTFYLRFRNGKAREAFDLKWENGDYLRSVYLKRQDEPPLGLNSRGRVSPIRPEFIAYLTDVDHDRTVGLENRLLAAEWRAFFPHTIQRGTVMCNGCHDNPRRFILERPEERIFDLGKDGMSLTSFWAREGQRVVNGTFMPPERFGNMTRRGPAYNRAYLEKWKKLTDRVDASSPR